MLQIAEVTQLISATILEINDQLPPDGQLSPNLDTVLIGTHSSLDSLALVTLLATVERNAEVKWGVQLMLFDAMASGLSESPFSSVGTLVDYISKRIDNRPQLRA